MKWLKTKTFFANSYPLQFPALSLCFQVLTLPHLCFVSLSFLPKIFTTPLCTHSSFTLRTQERAFPIPQFLVRFPQMNSLTMSPGLPWLKKKIARGQTGMSLQGFEGSSFVHFAKALCSCSSSNRGRPVRAQRPQQGWAGPPLCGAQHTGELQMESGGCVPSWKGSSPPCRYLQHASPNNHKWEHRNLLLQEKEQTVSSPMPDELSEKCMFLVGRAAGGRGGGGGWEMGMGWGDFIL